MLGRVDTLVAAEQHELVRPVVVRCGDGGLERHEDACVCAVGVDELGAGDFRAAVVQLAGGEAVGGDGLCGKAQRGGFQGGIGAAGRVEVGRVVDAKGGVLVAADGVRGGLGADVEVLDLGAEGWAGGAREGECVRAASGVEGEVDAPCVRCPAPGGGGVVARCGGVGWAPEEGEVKEGFWEAVDEVATAVLCKLFGCLGELWGCVRLLSPRDELVVSLESGEPAVDFLEIQLLVWCLWSAAGIGCRAYSVHHTADRAASRSA